MKILDNFFQTQFRKQLHQAYGHVQILKETDGSLYMPAELPEAPVWKVTGPTDFDKFIKRMELTAVDGSGKEVGKYTMATRGDAKAGKNVTMIIPTFRDKFGRLWTMIQEELRPIDGARRGKDARVLAFPAGIIGDEAAFASESAAQSAVRELAEETGMAADKIKALSPTVIKDGKAVSVPIMTSPGLTDEATYFFEARIKSLKPVTKAVTDGGVTRGWYFVPVRKIPKWLESLSKLGEIPSGQTLSALALYMAKKFRI